MANPQDSSTSDGITSSTGALSSQSSNDATPTFTDNASPSSTSGPDSANTGLVSHYFIFIALLLCIVGIALFLMWRRKKRLYMLQQHAYQNDVRARGTGTWAPPGWRTGEENGEQGVEGLNERGEPPPPYMPKESRVTVVNEVASGASGSYSVPAHAAGPEIPLQTLSRERAALREPPGYESSPASRADESAIGDYWRSPQRPG